ncbi:hypothetical protein [Streptomyces sp. NBC_01276]|uniref:hypothetical protein n=1 Tax=Streptomyces sp. NBC_01276 TaxID=2903808 RepID=UPI00352CD2DB
MKTDDSDYLTAHGPVRLPAAQDARPCAPPAAGLRGTKAGTSPATPSHLEAPP